METPIKKTRSRVKKSVTKPTAVTEAGSPVMFVTIEEHQKIIDEKTLQIKTLENTLNASESNIKTLNTHLTEYNHEARNLKFNVTVLTHEVSKLKNKLDSIPSWVKYLFGVK
jgi:predicted RNase H-like nuclease (RuvC/YqgF family)